jgi:hypothetical protein
VSVRQFTLLADLVEEYSVATIRDGASDLSALVSGAISFLRPIGNLNKPLLGARPDTDALQLGAKNDEQITLITTPRRRHNYTIVTFIWGALW